MQFVAHQRRVHADLLLNKAGQKQGKITILPSVMLGLPIKAFAAGGSVYLPGQEPV